MATPAAALDPMLVVPSIIGVFLGGQIGSRLTRHIRAQRLALIFALILLYLGVSLLLRAAIPPRSARKSAALRERWAQQVGLTNALGQRLEDEVDEQAMIEAAVEEVHATMGVHASVLVRLRSMPIPTRHAT